MTARLTTWFSGRSRREKWMILAMLALFGVALIVGIARPVDEALSSARRRNADAAIRLAQTEAQLDALKVLRRTRPDRLAGSLDAVVRQSADSAGFSLDSVTPDGNRLRVHIGSAKGGAMLAWLSGLEEQGVLVDDLNVTDNGQRAVSADITFRAMTI
jgi:general secretion pathway protein M